MLTKFEACETDWENRLACVFDGVVLVFETYELVLLVLGEEVVLLLFVEDVLILLAFAVA